MKSRTYRTYQGFEYDASMKLLPLTRKALKALSKSKAITFERDDSPEGYESMHQLIEVCSAIGMDIFPEHLQHLTKEDHEGYNKYPYCMAILFEPKAVS